MTNIGRPIVAALWLLSGCGEAVPAQAPVVTFSSSGGSGGSVGGGDTRGDSAGATTSNEDGSGLGDGGAAGGRADSRAGGSYSGDVSLNSDAVVGGDVAVGNDAGGCEPNANDGAKCDGIDNDCDGQTDEDPCSDDDACTIDDKCVGKSCKPGLPLACDDANGCTNDTCESGSAGAPGSGCLHANNNDICDDADACTGSDQCAGGNCTGDVVPCDDKNPCTDDSCDKAKGCGHAPNIAACDDGDACSTGDLCAGGACKGKSTACQCKTDADCTKVDDANPCNGTLICAAVSGANKCVVDPKTVVTCGKGAACNPTVCDPKTGKCGSGASQDGAACSDDNSCTIGDACKAGKCASGAAKTCDDADPCSKDFCVPADGACQHVAFAGTCDDDNPCTVGDTCAMGQCVGGKPKSCDDANVCTSDSCVKNAVVPCQYLATNAACSDGNVCTTGDKCEAGTCTGKTIADCNDGNACTDDLCDVTANSGAAACKHTPNAAKCTDNNVCTLSGTCAAKACKVAPKTCDDGNLCTKDTCDPKGGTDGKGCVFTPANGEACDDGVKCTLNDTCAAKSCKGTPNTCSDNNPCTTDSCGEKAGCENLTSADGGACSDGDPCHKQGTCKAAKCEGVADKDCKDTDPCTVDACAPNGTCTHAQSNGKCDDGNLCTQDGTCVGGSCKKGLPLNCNDGLSCTTNACDLKTGCTAKMKPGTYTAPCDGKSWGGRCYKAFSDSKKLLDADSHCKNWGGHLASIGNGSENEHVRKLSVTCNKSVDSYFWIGFTDAAKEGTFKWLDGSSVKYTKWRNGEPNNAGGVEDAAAMFRSDGTWFDYPAWLQTSCWVCERSLPLECDDANKCTKLTTCQKDGACKGQVVTCDDGSDCTVDACDSKSGCSHSNAKEGAPCGGVGSCSKGLCDAGSATKPGLSCKSLHLGNPKLVSSVYWLDPDGPGNEPKFQAYCEMKGDDGGWTMVLKMSGHKSTFAYDSNHWKTKQSLNSGFAGFDQTEAKLLSYSTVPFTAIRLGLKVGSQLKWLVVPYSAKSLHAVIADGKYRATSVGRNKWKSLIGGSSLQVNCNREGFNARVGSVYAMARIGIVSNNENHCYTPDSRLGFGTGGLTCSQDSGNTCGNSASKSCLADKGTVNDKAFGYVMVR